MPAKILQPAVYALLGSALVFAIVELGLSAHTVSSYGDRDGSSYTYDYDSFKKRQDYSDYFDEYDYSDYNLDSSSYYDISTPPIAAFAIFASVWTIVVSAGAMFTAWFFSRKSPVRRFINMIFAGAYVAVYFITMAFWLGTFADYAYVTSWLVYTPDYWKATLAFAVLLWSVVHPVCYYKLTVAGSSSWPCLFLPSSPSSASCSPTGRGIRPSEKATPLPRTLLPHRNRRPRMQRCLPSMAAWRSAR
jgi:hypothetical protein